MRKPHLHLPPAPRPAAVLPASRPSPALSPALALALLLGLLLAVTAAPAHAADNGSWSVYPASPAAAARPYFYVSADPGQTIEDKVVVANRTGAPLTFRLYAADAYNTARDGGFAVRTLKERMRGVGAWAKPARDRVTVPAHGSVTVPVTLTVPRDAEPGDHPGAIVALDERVDAGSGSLAVGVQRAVGARVYLRVSGPALPAISVEDVRISHHQPLVPGLGAGTATISYTLRNTGNVTLGPKVQLTVRGLFGRTLLSRAPTRIPAELLPGQRVRLSEPWHGSPQFDRGEVTLTASAQGTRESASASFLALPWLLVAVVFVAGVAGGVLLVRVRRGRARRSVPARPSRPESPTPSRRRSSPSVPR
ncbi:WxL protein peptidoglycan domain-containing protein [Streptomyces sp. NPDC059766]|uniref:WxL protein peptidoglycan domain-containing protein n=1 Tax=Streptomyces sp. NPDC059766 TaxID=3346940 RepID=UPI00365FBBAE